jgi:F-type H+-transporting ATPase subunit delta
MNKIAIEYGKALAQSVDKSNVKQIIDEYSRMISVFDDSREWASSRPEEMGVFEILCHENIPIGIRRNILDDVLLELKADTVFSNFTKVMLESARLPEIYNTYEVFRKVSLEANGCVDVKVTSAFEIDEQTEKRIVKIVEKLTDNEPVLRISIDKKLIGGMIIRFEDTCLDLTVKGQLKTIRHSIAG